MTSDLSKLINLIQTKNYFEAESHLKKLLKDEPNNFTYNKLLGISLLSQKKYNSALKAFNICYEENNNDYEINVNLSYLFLKIQDYAMAIKFANEAITANPSGPSSYHNLAESYLALQKFDAAKENALLSIKYRGGFNSKEILNYPDLIDMYSDILVAKNEIEDFKKFAVMILNTGSFQGTLLRKLIKNSFNDVSQKFIDVAKNTILGIDKFKNLVERNSFSASANFCLAEYYAKNKNQKQSEIHYIQANQLIFDMQRISLFKRQKKFYDIMTFCKNFNFTDIKNAIDPDKGKGLIFIVGMPRSGTTLTESIISTANDVIAGGEKVFFTVQLKPHLENLHKTNFDFQFFCDLGDRYLENIKMQRNQSLYFIDKLPENYIYFDFIKTALPAAKFIHVFRDPWDNAISLFKEHYAENLYYASSFFGIALEYANYETMIKFLKTHNGDNCMYDVNYAELVSNTEFHVKEIWDFCELQGKYSEENRKNHYANTASKEQVREKIYKTSLGKDDFVEYKGVFFDDLQSQRAFWLSKIQEMP